MNLTGEKLTDEIAKLEAELQQAVVDLDLEKAKALKARQNALKARLPR